MLDTTDPKHAAADLEPRRFRVTAIPIRWWLAAALAILAAAGGTAYWFNAKQMSISYVTAPATRGIVVRTVTATGTVNPVLTVTVGSYVSGVIRDQYCDFNTRVRVGQLCAKIDPRLYQATVNQDRANLVNARAQLLKDRAVLEYDKIAYERDEGLVKRGIVSQDTVDSAQSAYAQALAQIQVDAAVIQQNQSALESALVNLGYTDIISPVDGTVVSRNVTIGQTVAASFQTPTLFLIATDLTQMQIDTNVSESDIAGLREGDAAAFTVEAYPNRGFTGKVLQFRQAPQTVQNVVTYDVVIGVENRDRLLKPGMTATARIITEQRKDVLRVPDQALRYSPADAARGSAASAGRAGIWVLRNGRPSPVSVRIGLDDDNNAEVLMGDIRVGEQVIVSERRTRGTAAASQPRLVGF